MDIPALDPALLFYCSQGVAQTTARTYSVGLRRFYNFCAQFDILQPFPVSEQLLCYFVAALANQGLSPATIRTYLAAIRNSQIARGWPTPGGGAGLPRLRLIQNGVARVQAQQSRPSSRVRRPVTLDILQRMNAWQAPTATTHDGAMIQAAMLLCFFGFFRAGEITVPSVGGYDPAVHLSWGDVTTDHALNPTVIRVHLKRSKCDQLGRGVDVFVGRTGNDLCPVTAILRYTELRGNTAGPFFRFQDGQPLTKAKFTNKIRQSLHGIGVQEGQYAGHSFRIGAATTAAGAGIEDSTIQMLGRWTSHAFLRYIRTPRAQLASFTQRLATASRGTQQE